MKLTIINSLYIAGAILLASAILSQFENSKLILSTLMIVGGLTVLILAIRKDRAKLKACFANGKNRTKLIGLICVLALVFLGLGYKAGKLIYLWSQV